jgi:hypothetical protein
MKIFSSIFLLILLSSGTIRDDVSVSKAHRFAEQPVFDCIGEIFFEKEQQQSCILIDATHILTSAHAFYRGSGKYQLDSLFLPDCKRWIYGNLPEKSVLGDMKNYTIRLKGDTYKIKSIKVHEQYANAKPYRDEYGLQLSEGFKYDIAIAELEKPILNIKPAQLFEGNNELNQRAIMAGYRYIEKSSDFTKSRPLHFQRKTGGENMIDSIGHFKVDDRWAGLFFDFDAPNSDCCNRMGDAKALPLEYYPNGGDCGSGLFIKESGTWKLAGMCSAEDIPCETFNFAEKNGHYYGFTCNYLRIFAFKSWIRNQIQIK